ncbi:hypothetical protein RB614_35960 [Phytohabitans sp. ZYX-F-186]|uniref:DUF1468 domain-containing protein n=1 Tax=Phytohabitans maris TaxID=3071409 RepID=A0ABU0ZVE3_9ACTN|nr:tripartite tricarboxylate transporter TctB family protein [Phytohabitans sp. ZYX-F-186]MDQ7909907.1 hypothetical protein [Phytohabitans sp. ZYX-F-186]
MRVTVTRTLNRPSRAGWAVLAAAWLVGVVVVTDSVRAARATDDPSAVDGHIYLVVVAAALVVMLTLSVLLEGAGRGPVEGDRTGPAPVLTGAALVGLVAGYAICFSTIGFLLPTAVFVAVAARLIGPMPWWLCAVFGVVAAVATRLVFVDGAGMVLPRGVLGW